MERDWERMVTYYAFPRVHWTHIRTTNLIESPFAAVRLRTGAAKRFTKVEYATALIWGMLLVVEQHFRELNAPHLLAEAYAETQYKDGARVVRDNTRCLTLVYTLPDKTSYLSRQNA